MSGCGDDDDDDDDQLLVRVLVTFSLTHILCHIT